MSTEIDREIAPGIRLRFDSPVSLMTFLSEEQQRWAAVASAKTKHPTMAARAVQHQSQRLSKMINQTKAVIANKPADWASEMGSLQFFSENGVGRALCSLIPADAAVLHLVDTDPDAAVVGMSARQRAEDTINTLNPNDRADGQLALSRFAVAGVSRTVGEESFAMLSNMINQAMGDWRRQITDAAELAKAIAREAKQTADAAAAETAAQAKAHGEMLDEHKKALEAIKQQFLSEMSLRAPVEYWKVRASTGHGTAQGWLKAFVAAAVILFTVVLWQGPGLLSLLKDKNDQVSLAAVPLLLAALVPLLWVLRHMARMFADNVADARDADQRAALTSTFLALSTQEKVSFSENERAIIVQALFRPSPAQPTDDGVPVPLLELLKR